MSVADDEMMMRCHALLPPADSRFCSFTTCMSPLFHCNAYFCIHYRSRFHITPSSAASRHTTFICLFHCLDISLRHLPASSYGYIYDFFIFLRATPFYYATLLTIAEFASAREPRAPSYATRRGYARATPPSYAMMPFRDATPPPMSRHDYAASLMMMTL